MYQIIQEDSYKCTPTNSKVYLVDPESPSTDPSMSLSTIPSIVPTNLHKLIESNIIQKYGVISSTATGPEGLEAL